eukprot:CAMPEP_0204585306 /NCGR_PEP_ID=MMETSP0661-20131031/46840_1 /ASSEMBLY_ACC=CAM_ASM_000606 /TAXON_ID=109239 /ORGANISM="Alexandrium margalefi, Strain AMGDE01CS-322" /LENGTH=36 /DNA_ID= /DNA_START= /DNA_END= /DNA_ORIENTATION=
MAAAPTQAPAAQTAAAAWTAVPHWRPGAMAAGRASP